MFPEKWWTLGGLNHLIQYYREVLLMQKLLPDIKEFSDYFTFQQDSAPAHCTKETVDLLKRKTPDFIEN